MGTGNVEEYIYRAVELEEQNKIDEALKVAREGYTSFLDSYELLFMNANYNYCLQNYEEAYVCYLVAVCLSEGEDRKIIEDNWKAIDVNVLDVEKVKTHLKTIIEERIIAGEYVGTYKVVSNILFAFEGFLVQKVIDKWLRYYYILLEITSCEINRGCKNVTLQRFDEWKEFEYVMREFKFVFRRLWFGLPENESSTLIQLVQKYKVSPDFLAVVGKYSVYEDYISSLLYKMAEKLGEAGLTEHENILLTYGQWIGRVQKVNKELMDCEPQKRKLNIFTVDAGAGKKAENNDADNMSISFILCANNEEYVKEVTEYISYQNLPNDYEVNVYVVYNAKSMAQGYNVGMKLSKSKYKIYIHQDTFIFDPDYTWNLVQELQKSKYHMLGVAGAGKMPSDGVWWNCNPLDKHLCLYQDTILSMLPSVTESSDKEFVPTVCLDGVLIATSVDVMWREDLFENFHFYDVSQSYGFHQADYKVGIYNNSRIGVLHEMSVGKSAQTEHEYEVSRQKFVREFLG